MEVSLTSTWSADPSQLKAILHAGDLVEIDRLTYYHWAVYVGDGNVVHQTGDNHCCSSFGPRARVSSTSGTMGSVIKKDTLETAMQDSNARMNNSYDSERSPGTGSEIAKRAKDSCRRVTYRLLRQNCEHFANWCRYGEKKSHQADTVIKYGLLMGFIATVFSAVLVFNRRK